MCTLIILLQSQMPMTTQLLFILVFLVCFTVFVLYLKHDSRKHVNLSDSAQDDASPTVDDFVAAHGEPEAEFLLDATRSNELEYVILVYEKEIVVNGEIYERDKITDVTFNNAANPYVACDYQLVLTTTLPDKPTIKAPLGSDAQWAKDIATDLAQHLNVGDNPESEA